MFILKKFFLFYLTLFSFLTGFKFTSEDIFKKIPHVNSPQQVIWLDTNSIVIVDDNDIFKFNFNSRVLESIDQRLPNEFVGLDLNDDLLFCRFEHFIIHSYDDFSTRFLILDKDKEVIKELEFFETIRPILLFNNTVIAVTALDFLEEHFYEINLDTGIKKEIDKPSMRGLYFNIGFDVRRVFRFKDMYIFEDMDGYLFY